MIEEKKVQAAKVVTHILGLNAAGETTLELPAVGGGKKLVYTGKYLPLTSLTQIQDEELAAILARDGLPLGAILPITIAMDHRALDYSDIIPFMRKLDEIFANAEVLKQWK